MKTSAILAASFLLMGGGLFADSVTSSSSFSSFSSVFSPGQINPAPNAPGSTFWNNYSPDIGVGSSHDENIGYALTTTGGFQGLSPLIGSDLPAGTLLGTAGADPTSFDFIASGDAYTIQVLFSDTGLPGEMTFGWYDVSNPTVLNPIFSGIGETSTPLTAESFTHGSATEYGFYATVCYNPPACNVTVTYYTDAGEDTNNEDGVTTAFGTITNNGFNHFALFDLGSNSQSYVLGVSESPNPNGAQLDGDFNDFVVELTDIGQAGPGTPEPATLGIVGAGLLALGFLRRRSRA